jgi:hypothetical protein
MHRQQNRDQNHNILTANKSFENMAKFIYLGRVTKITFKKKLRTDYIWGMLANMF